MFLSHAGELRDLPEPRSFVTAVAAAVQHAGDVLVDVTHLSADPPARATVAGSDVFVLLAGFRYGTPVPDRPELSYAEHEFDVAGELGIPRLVFLLSDRVRGTARLFVDPRYGARQIAFRARLRDSGSVTADVDSPDHAETVVAEALARLPRAVTAAAPADRVWGIPARSGGFTGRRRHLKALHTALNAAKHSKVQALHGAGGVGKSALAVEYAHLHATEYDIGWWISAERPDLIPDQLAALAKAMDLADAADPPNSAVERLLDELRVRERWLLVFDDAENAAAIADYLPGGAGHVLITSRHPRWQPSAASMKVGDFTRRESVALLRSHLPDASDDDADRLAKALDDLPLAVDQAGAALAATGWTVATYCGQLAGRTQRLLPRHDPASGYPLSAAAAWQVTFDQLTGTDLAALQLVTLAAWLAPEPIPLTVFTDHPAALPEPLATAVGDPVEWARSLDVLRRRAVARVDHNAVLLHRIPAALLRTHSAIRRPGWAVQAVLLLAAATPADPWNQPATWPVWQVLLPHVAAVTDPDRDTGAVADDVDCLVELLATYLHARGRPDAARPYFERTHQRYTSRLGDDHPSTLACANSLAIALRDLGEVALAHELDQEILHRLGHIVDGDRPPTRDSALNLVIDLSAPVPRPEPAGRPRHRADDATDPRIVDAHERAWKHRQDILERRRRILGENHPDTLDSAHNLANTLHALGRHEQARELEQDTLERRRETLGEHHPDTLDSAHKLAKTLHILGNHEQAGELEKWFARSG